jgi:hypothetical protein
MAIGKWHKCVTCKRKLHKTYTDSFCMGCKNKNKKRDEKKKK